jgi:hypothetical protein
MIEFLLGLTVAFCISYILILFIRECYLKEIEFLKNKNLDEFLNYSKLKEEQREFYLKEIEKFKQKLSDNSLF